jgi:hypothetical protein
MLRVLIKEGVDYAGIVNYAACQLIFCRISWNDFRYFENQAEMLGWGVQLANRF